LIEKNQEITTVLINRPTKLNALNKVTIEELHHAMKAANEDKDTKVIILTGGGEKAFVAGADIAEFAHFSVQEGMQLASEGQKLLFDYIENLSTPVIAAINGFALGGGLELAMSAHFRIASDNAKMGLPEVTLGVIPGYGGTQRLPQLVGKGRAMEMILSAQMIDAQKALQFGLVNYVVAQTELLSLAQELALKIAKNSTKAVAYAIDAVNSGYREGINGYEIEIENFGMSFGTEDFKEGTTAFLEKRKANFPGK
jgi:enoyl-CoA hydratase